MFGGSRGIPALAARRGARSLCGLALAAALAAPAHADPAEPEAAAPEPARESTTSDTGAAAQEPYEYPASSEETAGYPSGFWRAPAAAVDLLLVRPAMVVGLAGAAALFVATLPFTAPTLTTDDAAHALVDQAESTFARPLGRF